MFERIGATLRELPDDIYANHSTNTVTPIVTPMNSITMIIVDDIVT